MNSPNHIKPINGQLEITPASVGWQYLSFKTVLLKAGQSISGHTAGEEAALVPLSGALEVRIRGQTVHLRRSDVFSELPTLIYMPPHTAYTVQASADSHFALGSAPAEGRYPLRVITPDQIKVELRGGANATRQVSHILGPDLPAERLLLYEVYTPSGFWSGWPPHRHDGLKGSLYIEETYYYRINPAESGWAIHRNYSPEHGLDELLMVKDGDLVLTPVGYHPVSAPPGSNVYYLNYMAGEAINEQRSIAPVDDADWAWMRQDWSGKPIKIPFGTSNEN
ncbi:MAG: 5-deoxy-glucuronate isomerase [Thermaceae bacterium]|nr:5-deoxy-glucuronate isomerase [Thermaceae bacterium]